MAATLLPLFLFSFFFPLSAAILVPVRKDPTSLQYTATLRHRAPSTAVTLSLDLGGRFLWLSRRRGLPTRRPVACRSTHCASARSSSCRSSRCSVPADNPFAGALAAPSDLFLDSLALHPNHTLVPRFLFASAPSALRRGLAAGSSGVLPLSRALQSLPSQLASSLALPLRFSLCLPTASPGFVLFGAAPGSPAADALLYTPLLANPVSAAAGSAPGEPSYEYFVGVRGIEVAGESVPIDAGLLSVDREGFGGTKISTTQPYAVAESTIFEAVAAAFERRSGMRRAPALAPFSRCFEGGADPPEIDLVLQSKTVVWRLRPVVEVGGEGVVCLAIVDGGKRPRTTLVIGGQQLEEKLLVFDLAGSRLGFSSDLPRFHGASCQSLHAVAAS